MPPDDRTTQVLRRHKRWADGCALVWFFLSMTVFAAVWFLPEQGGVEAVERIPAFILLSTVMLRICIWQAAGALAARIELSRDSR